MTGGVGEVRCEYVIRPEFQGYPGIAHGGIVAAILARDARSPVVAEHDPHDQKKLAGGGKPQGLGDRQRHPPMIRGRVRRSRSTDLRTSLVTHMRAVRSQGSPHRGWRNRG
jgi:hypothetical protein